MEHLFKKAAIKFYLQACTNLMKEAVLRCRTTVEFPQLPTYIVHIFPHILQYRIAGIFCEVKVYIQATDFRV